MFWQQTAPESARKASKRTDRAASVLEGRTAAVAGATYKVMPMEKFGKATKFGIGERQIDQVLFHRVLWKGEVFPFDKKAQAQALVNQLNAQAKELLK